MSRGSTPYCSLSVLCMCAIFLFIIAWCNGLAPAVITGLSSLALVALRLPAPQPQPIGVKSDFTRTLASSLGIRQILLYLVGCNLDGLY